MNWTSNECSMGVRTTRFRSLLVASTIGVYVLILVGITDSLTNAAATCPSWPVCGAPWLASTGPETAVVLGHRLAALVVGLLLVVTVFVAWRRRIERRIQLVLGAVVGLYPVEIWIGALTAVDGTPIALSTLHLVVAMAIFSGLLVTLCWQLEAEVPAVPASGHEDIPIAPATPTDSTVTASVVPDGPVDRPADRRPTTGVRGYVGAYVALTKPKLWWLLCLVAFASMSLANGGLPPVWPTVATLGGGVFAIGASGTFNNVLERGRDERMARTDDRPLVTGTIPVGHALAFGVVLTISSVVIFLAFVNTLAAGLGLLAILFYSVVYTLVLKPRTTQNVVVGGAVGAFPALIGWAAITDTVGVPAVVLGGVIFLWTPAHFYNLALAYKDDYARAGFPMLSVVRGEATTRRHILAYLGATMVGAGVLGTAASLNWVYATVALGGGGVFLWAVVRLYGERTDRAAFRAFMASNAYLGMLLVAIVVDTVLL